MISKKHIKIGLVIATLITAALLHLLISYDLIDSGLLSGSDNRKIYNTVCSNIDIRFQKLDYLSVDDKIRVNIKDQTIPYLLGFEKYYDKTNYQTMFQLHDELQQYSNSVFVSVGAVGSSNYQYGFGDGTLEIQKYWPYEYENWGLSSYDVIETAMLRDDIKRLYLEGSEELRLDLIDGELSSNNSIEYLQAFSGSNELSVLTKFEALNTLDLSIRLYEDNNDHTFKVSSFNNLPQLETLIIHADTDYLDFTDVINKNIKTLEIRYRGEKAINANDIKMCFPNADITIVEDSYY